MARVKDRARGGARAPAAPVWRVGAYIRLSREDAGRGGDGSNSVLNQRRLLDEYHRAHLDEFADIAHYIDDGATGTDLSRAGFQRLLADVMGGKINCVMVKDLSRLSRNYSDAGSLIETLFVQLNIRFISLSENIDSYRNPDSVSNLVVPITNVMNDNFCYQTSQKIRQVFDHKRRSGAHIGSFAAYGYCKDPADKNALVIDPEAAGVVRRVFSMYLDGASKSAIVRTLNEQGIACPSAYKRSKGLNYQNGSTAGVVQPLWCAKTVTDMLKNRLYLGDMVQGRYRVKSYKVHTQQAVPEDEWFVVENTHEPIIDRQSFERVQALLRRDTRTPPGGRAVYLFGGLLRCADCGRAMSRSAVRGNVYYYCRTYKDQSKAACTRHSVRHEELKAAVLCALRQQISLGADCAALLAAVDAAPQRESRLAQLEGLLACRERERGRIVRYKQQLYQDWKDGALTQRDYEELRAAYEHRQVQLDVAVEALNAQRGEAIEEPEEDALTEGLRTHGNIEHLTRDVLLELVEQIHVHEGGRICIQLRFCGGTER